MYLCKHKCKPKRLPDFSVKLCSIDASLSYGIMKLKDMEGNSGCIYNLMFPYRQEGYRCQLSLLQEQTSSDKAAQRLSIDHTYQPQRYQCVQYTRSVFRNLPNI